MSSRNAVAILAESDAERVPDLVPERYARMSIAESDSQSTVWSSAFERGLTDHGRVHAARELAPAALLDLLLAADALRRPERLDTLLEACECDAMSLPGRTGDYAAAAYVRAALVVVKGVDAAAVARNVQRARPARAEPDGAIAKAVRAARLKALGAWRKATAVTR